MTVLPCAEDLPKKSLSPLGRPTAERAQLLAQEVLRVSAQLMLQHGFDGTSLDAIAAAAGCTKRTIYARFGSKEHLLREVLRSAAVPTTQHFVPLTRRRDLRDRLIQFGAYIHDSLLRPDIIEWIKFVTVELAKRPDLTLYVHPLMEQHSLFVQHVLQGLVDEGQLKVNDVPTAAMFFSTLMTEPAKRWAYLAISPGTRSEQTRYVHRAVDVFLSGCALGETQPAPAVPG